MTNRVLLNNIDHQTLRVITRRSAEFGDNINQALVFPTEFEELQREYPIFFRRESNGDFQSVALLGLDRDENLFLDETGWRARYIPAVQERGPFLIGFQEQIVDGEKRREPMVHIDLDHPSISRAEGEPIFLPHGGNSAYLNRIAHTLRSIHQGAELAKLMFAAFEAEGLIEPVEVEIALDDRTQYKLPDLYTIGEDRLSRLDGATLERLHRAGVLRPAFCVASSLGNVSRLIDMKNKKRATG
jgi:hypothetical protein